MKVLKRKASCLIDHTKKEFLTGTLINKIRKKTSSIGQSWTLKDYNRFFCFVIYEPNPRYTRKEYPIKSGKKFVLPISCPFLNCLKIAKY
jgi:hypothetical protein